MAELLLHDARSLQTGESASLLVRDGAVADGQPSRACRRLSAGGLWLAPGFVDLQLNGAFGHDFATEPHAIWRVGERLAAGGVTAFVPTLVSSPPAARDAAFDAWAARPAAVAGAQPLGWHFEGPMLAPARAGAHDLARLCLPAEVDLTGWTAARGLRLATLAPELPGAPEAIRRLSAAGVVVAAGHTDADASAAGPAVEAGVRYATHLLNAMRGLDPRAPGIAAGLLLDHRVTVGLIADGHHLAPAILALAWRGAGPARTSLVTDGTAALGAAAGRHRLGEVDVVLGADGSVRRSDGRLAGAAGTLAAGLRNLREATGCTPEEAVASVTSVPARLLGLPDRGQLHPGARGDAVLLDDDLRVVATVVAGQPVHGAEAMGWG